MPFGTPRIVQLNSDLQDKADASALSNYLYNNAPQIIRDIQVHSIANVPVINMNGNLTPIPIGLSGGNFFVVGFRIQNIESGRRLQVNWFADGTIYTNYINFSA